MNTFKVIQKRLVTKVSPTHTISQFIERFTVGENLTFSEAKQMRSQNRKSREIVKEKSCLS